MPTSSQVSRDTILTFYCVYLTLVDSFPLQPGSTLRVQMKSTVGTSGELSSVSFPHVLPSCYYLVTHRILGQSITVALPPTLQQNGYTSPSPPSSPSCIAVNVLSTYDRRIGGTPTRRGLLCIRSDRASVCGIWMDQV